MTKKSPAFAIVLATARLTKTVRTRCDNDRVLVFTDDHYQKSVIVSMLTRPAAQVVGRSSGRARIGPLPVPVRLLALGMVLRQRLIRET